MATPPPTVPRYVLPFEARACPHVFCDVLVIGSGIAGCVAALEAAEAGSEVLLVTKTSLGAGSSAWAQGGIAAALDPLDDVDAHVADTLRAGAGLCDEAVVRSILADAPGGVRLLQEWGARFDRDGESGELALAREGGHDRRRVAHAAGDATGREIQRALVARVQQDPRVRVATDGFAVDLLTSDDRCVGAIFLVGSELRIAWAGAVVLATGGAGRLFRESTNPSVVTGDGLAMAYRAGAELRDLEFMQFHPTVLYLPGAPRMLLSEAARGEGAVIRDRRGARFLESVHPLAELAPRDVVCRGIVDHLLAHGDSHATLDLSDIPEDVLRSRLPGVIETGRMAGIDVRRDGLPIRPAAHYTIGGVRSDLDGRTSLSGLLACGEVTSSGLHGANRLASNSLAEGVVMGRRAGRAAAAVADEGDAPTLRPLVGRDLDSRPAALDTADLSRSISSLLWRHAGVRREGAGLEVARRELRRWHGLMFRRPFDSAAGIEAQNLCILAGLLVDAAAQRMESRGAHWRVDHPNPSDDWRAHIVYRRLEQPRIEAVA